MVIDMGENEWCSEDDVFNCPALIPHREMVESSEFAEVSQD